ncbi:MAG: anti-sigma B factor RsbW [bacterium]
MDDNSTIQSNNRSDMIELTIPCKSEYVGVVRLTVSGIASRMAFSYDDIEDVKVAVGEACINAIKHAYPSSVKKEIEDNKILIRCTISPSKIDIFVKDTGVGFNYSQVNPNQKRDIPPKTGLGIFLMQSLMDSVIYKTELNNGTEVHMTKYLTNISNVN